MNMLFAHAPISRKQRAVLSRAKSVMRGGRTLSRRHAHPPEVQEILHRIETWAGGPAQAVAWYRSEPLPEFGDRTAESLVNEGRAAQVRDYLDHVAVGGFA
ncbi:antitoxin Xre/MbcA/ParS toxin-binding domain-containing protein [Jiella sp. M17.18]|uniref:antitoxin Xre/MbcA/ParS toxin-binding domain-containing protein n=1 Tax=Jiella sp. M17.18 TaxID=3234247 RepID=UPI0034E015C9